MCFIITIINKSVALKLSYLLTYSLTHSHYNFLRTVNLAYA